MIPPRRILVGVDFSECSRAALAFGARLALHAGAALDVLHVQDSTLTAAARAVHVNLEAESAEELRRFIRGTPPADALRPETFVICGTPGQVLCDIAAREQADVVVVGSHGMTGADRWLFGSNTQHVIRRARMSVLVVPAGWQPPRAGAQDLSGLGPVIAGVTVSEPAIAAAHAAARLARLLATRLTVLHVVPELRVPDRWMSHAASATAEAVRSASRELDALLAPLNTITPTNVTVVTGDVARSLLHAAEPRKPCQPFLVMGRRPADANGRAPGTVVSRVLASLRVPMLIVQG